MTRYAIVQKDTGRFWTGAWDTWSPFPLAARTFDFQTDALLAAYQECGADPTSYDAKPIDLRQAVPA